jgi:Spy/CpxP family protein refolding chaperone
MKKQILTAFLFASVAFAQSSANQHTPPTPAQIVANQVTHLTSLLSLTTSQQSQATTIFTAAQTTISTVRTDLQAAHTALTTAVEANDSAGIATQTTLIGTLTSQQALAQATADAAFYQILTGTQQTQFAAFLSEGPHGGPGGRGEFRGPGPGGL